MATTTDKIENYLTEKENRRLVRSKLQILDRIIDDFINYLEDKIDIIDESLHPVHKRNMEKLLANTTKEHGEFLLALRNVAAALDRGPNVIPDVKGTAKGLPVDAVQPDTEQEEDDEDLVEV